MIPSNYFSHNPDDLRNNYEDDSYSTTNYQPNANISNQHNLPPGSNPLMLQQHHFNDGRAPSRTNYSDVGASLPNNNKSPKLYATPYNDRSFDNNLQNYNNNNYNINDSNLDDFNNDVMNNENDNNNYNINNNNNNNNNSYNINNNNNNYNSNYNNNNNNSYNINNNNNNYNSNYRDNNDNYNSSPVLNDANFQSPAIASSIHPSSSHLPTEHIRPSDSYLLKENRATPLVEGGILNTSYRPQPSNQSRSQSINKFPLDSTLERPDLSEVIDLLSHQSNSVKANAAAYLQHLSYMDDNIKVQTRGLRGLPPLLDLLSHPDVQVHKAACGALRNLSYGKANDDNKREIVKLGGLTGLTRLLRRSRQDDVQEVVTGIIWNLSSCADLKTTIIDESLKALMDVVVVPLSGWSPSNAPHDTPHYRSTTFRNATSVLRNVSSEGVYARRKMRQCEGLVQSLFQVLLHSTQRQDCDNKSIENCVCVLRNLSFALQEVSDPEYLKKRMAPLHDGDDKAGCFGNKSKLVHKVKHESIKSPPTPAQLGSNPGMALLWSPRLLDAYLPLLKDCSNPDTLEATAGTIQNVTACDWMPSVVFRAAVRKQGGLPIITDLLNYSSDKVICSASTALRNLAIDQENKELIGKQSMRDLVSKLPAASTEPSDYPLSHHTLAALQSTLYQVVKNNLPFTRSLVNEGGVARLVAISKSVPPSYSEKVVRYANHLLYRVWKHTELQEELKRHGWSVEDAGKINQGGRLSADNTINRPIMNQGYQSARSNQPPSNHNTIDYKQPAVNKPNQQRDEEIALDVLHHMQLNDRYAASNGPNYNHNNNNANNNTLNNNNNNSLNYNNNNSSLNYTNNNNSLNYNNNNNNNTINNNVGNNTKNSYNSGYDGNYNTNNNNMDAYLNTLNSRGNQGSINNNMYNNNNINSNINSNNDMLNNDNYANDDDNYYNEYNQNNNKDFRGNSDFNLNSSNNNFNNTELFNQNYVANSLRPSTNSQGNNPQQLHRLSNNTQVSNHTNNFNTDAHNLNNNNPNNSYNNNNTTNSYNNNNTTNSYNNNNTNNGYNNNNSNNSNNNNNYNNSQQNIGSFFNTMQGFVAESSPQHLAYH